VHVERGIILFKSILLVVCEDSGNLKTLAAAVDLASVHGARLTVVCIADHDYESMLGDEWISDSGTLNRFFSYMEAERNRNTGLFLDEAAEKCKKLGVQVTVRQKTGKPGRAVMALFEELGPFDLVVINQSLINSGADRVKKEIDNIGGLVCPVLIYPEQSV